MILLIFCSLLIIALIAIFFLKTPQKLLILSICVILLVICNFINQIQALYDHHPVNSFFSPTTKSKQPIQHVNKTTLTTLDNNTFQTYGRQLMEQQRQIVSYLLKKSNNNEYPIVYFTELHKNRLKSILQLFQYRRVTNNNNLQKSTQIYSLNYHQYSCDYYCLSNNFAAKSKTTYVILIIQNIQDIGDINQIQIFYEAENITIILLNLPKYYNLHTISRLTQVYRFSGNYLPKVLEQHLPKVIENCSLYHTFDYAFYMNSLKTPLSQLCTRPLPSNSATKCLKKLILEQKQKIPENWGRKCLQQKPHDGIVVQNGWLGLKKQYFWSGKINNQIDTSL